MNTSWHRSLRRAALVGLALAFLTGMCLDTAFAGAGRTRPGGGGGGSGGGTAAGPGGGSGGGSAPQHAAGRATYGYGGNHHHGGYYPHYGGYYGWGYPYYYGWVGWPWGWWYGSAPYHAAWSNPHAPGAVETDVTPKKAEVLLDGRFVGQARDYNGRWDVLWIEPGDHTLEFVKDGYMTLRTDVSVRAGTHVRISEALQKGEGIDPRSSETVAAAPAPAPRPSEGAALERGLLRLGVAPADAAIYLDGEFLARGDELAGLHGALPVASGRHTVEVVRPGFASRTVEVDVPGDETVRLDIALEREE